MSEIEDSGHNQDNQTIDEIGLGGSGGGVVDGGAVGGDGHGDGDDDSLENSTYHDKIKFINQGTYGCIFRPAINCKGKLLKPSFITKIQSEKASSDKETYIGNKIKKIKGYSRYFAPILKTCNISLANIKNDEIKKCDFIDNKTTKIISNKMKYVGDKSLLDYFIYILEQKPNNINETIFDCYLHLLEGIDLLHKNNIIHYDLKENNIMYDETQDYPIIIDFGLSFDISNLDNLDNLDNSTPQWYKELIEAFYVYAPDYRFWCFEIHLICYIIQYIKENDLDDNISISFLNEGIDDLFKENLMFTHFNVDGYKKSLKEFIHRYSDLSYRELITNLLAFNYSWDNYSLAVIFLYCIYELELNETYIMTKLITLLKQIVFSTPDARIGIKETIDKVSDIYDEL